jgi:hypothetical protein
VASARFKLDPLTIALAVLAVVVAIVGALLVSNHPKRGAAAFIVAVLLACGAVYTSMRAAKTGAGRA